MKPKFHKLNDQSGVSLAETLIVVAIISIVASLAYFKMGTANTQFQRQNVARELKVAFERARFDSVKRHADGAGPATVTVTTNSYTVKTDINQNGVFEPEESVPTTFAPNITISEYSGSGPLAISSSIIVTFDKRGEITTTGGTSQFWVRDNADAPSGSNANIVLVTPTGTVNLLGGDATLPAFDTPAFSNVPPTTGINGLVSL